ncbi:MAG: hypothetical protein LBU34_01570 [Planctomycetaceae bacterium]|nr:hypothetical protein [Planctomycetaceae bacterium]
MTTTLEHYASAAASRKPTFSLNYSSEHNNLDSLSSVKSQADKLLYQLSNDWEREYSELALAIAVASILYIDETG